MYCSEGLKSEGCADAVMESPIANQKVIHIAIAVMTLNREKVFEEFIANDAQQKYRRFSIDVQTTAPMFSAVQCEFKVEWNRPVVLGSVPLIR